MEVTAVVARPSAKNGTHGELVHPIPPPCPDFDLTEEAHTYIEQLKMVRFPVRSMAASTYTYCYHGCVVDWLFNNTEHLGLNTYAGVVGVDHYWTHQGMPCNGSGKPEEFAKQDTLALKWKSKFPNIRMLQCEPTTSCVSSYQN